MSDVATSINRPSRQWPAIILSLALIAGSLAITKPWQRESDSTFGIVRQVKPPAAAAVDLETGPTMGKLAPNFLLQTFDGSTVRLSDLRGKPVFINFWATWCLFCVAEMPAMQRLADQYEGRLVIVGVNVGETLGEAQPFATENDIRYPLLLDPETNVTEAYRVQAMPTSLFVDANGVVQFVRYGVLTPDQMDAAVQPLLVPA